jgi:hypothetical protein
LGVSGEGESVRREALEYLVPDVCARRDLRVEVTRRAAERRGRGILADLMEMDECEQS